MKIIFIITAAIFFVSCNKQAHTIKQIHAHALFLEEEHMCLMDKLIAEHIMNEKKWEYEWNEINDYNNRYSEIERLLENNALNNAVFQKVDSFYLKTTNSIIDDSIINLCKKEYTNWKENYNPGYVFSEVELGLFLIRIKALRNAICKGHFDFVNKYRYKFNVIKPITYEESTELNIGDTYKAEIFIAAHDNYELPVCDINGQRLTMKDGTWIFEVPCKRKGMYKWNGQIQLKDPIGRIIAYPIEGEYKVK
jgi:hypothetical protein